MPENASHTPGPLHTVEYETPYAETHYAVNRGSETLATGIRKKADARLYAAAPDLLAALQQMLYWFDPYRPTREQRAACYAAEAAIAKATGNSQDANAADAAALAAVHPVADAAAEAAKSAAEAAFASPADGMVCKNPMPSGRRACDALPLDDCPCRSAEAAFASPVPAPGTDATTADGRFVSGSGYGGERM